jgi:hypothetical protein
MHCEKQRERLNQDPARLDSEFSRHAADCPACTAYSARLNATEALIQQVLRFDVAALKAGNSPARDVATERRSWVPAFASAAAGIVAVLAAWALLAPAPNLTVEQLAAEVVAHWYHERQSWVQTDVAISNATLISALDGKAEIDIGSLGRVSYAQSCFVAGEWIPHIVIQGNAGPFMVLLLPGQRLDDSVQLSLEAEGLGGHVVPVGDGAIAVLGPNAEESAEVEEAVAGALAWTI